MRPRTKGVPRERLDRRAEPERAGPVGVAVKQRRISARVMFVQPRLKSSFGKDRTVWKPSRLIFPMDLLSNPVPSLRRSVQRFCGAAGGSLWVGQAQQQKILAAHRRRIGKVRVLASTTSQVTTGA